MGCRKCRLAPERLGRTHHVHLSPHAGSISQTVLAAVVVLVSALTGQDPVLALFTWLTQLGTLAIITLMALASFAVVAFFLRHPDLDRNRWRTLVAPVLGGLATAAVAVYAASQFGLLIGKRGQPAEPGPAGAHPGRRGGRRGLGARSQDPQPELYAVMGRHRGDEQST